MLYKVITYDRKNFDYKKKKNKCLLSTKKYLIPTLRANFHEAGPGTSYDFKILHAPKPIFSKKLLFPIPISRR